MFYRQLKTIEGHTHLQIFDNESRIWRIKCSNPLQRIVSYDKVEIITCDDCRQHAPEAT